MSTGGAHPGRARFPAWGWLVLFVAATVTVFELALLTTVTGLFTHGFNTGHIRGLWSALGFVGLSLAIDVPYQLGLWIVLVPLLRFLRFRPPQLYFLLFVVGFVFTATQSFYRYGVFWIAGEMIDQRILSRIAHGGATSVALEAFEGLPILWVILLGLTFAGTALGLFVVGRLEGAFPDSAARLSAPRMRSLWVGFALTFTFAGILSQWVDRDSLRYGAARKTSGAAFEQVLTRLSDFDADGYGLASPPIDPAPFDAGRTPYTTEIPGNGRDENGLAGDLPLDFESASPIEAPLPEAGVRPHLLVIFLESFRLDTLGSELNGRRVTPALDELVRTGASTPHAYSNVGWTISSRAQLFNGVLVPAYDQETIVDDFKQLGYRVGFFSGQDESFGRSEGLTGFRRADVAFDARDDVDRRTSRSTSSASLQISWKTLEERVFSHLDAIDPGQPQLVYVNIVDTHYPYTHDELDDILGVPPLTRDEIRAETAERVREGYANTAANVDRAVGRLVARWRAAIGNADHAILVLSDHGESIYDEGILGHGLTIDEHSMRIPFIVWGIGGEWPELIGPADVRGLLRRNLFVERGENPPRARFVATPERSMLQYAPSLTEPARIGLRTVDGVSVYDFMSGDYRPARPEAQPVPSGAPNANDPSTFQELVWRWEKAQADRERLGHLR